MSSYNQFQLRHVSGHIYFLLVLQDDDFCMKPLEKEVSKTCFNAFLTYVWRTIDQMTISNILRSLYCQIYITVTTHNSFKQNQRAFLMGDMLLCHSRTSSSITNTIMIAFFHFTVTWKPHQWMSMNTNRTLEWVLLNGMHP